MSTKKRPATYREALAAASDAANRNMRKQGRETWNNQDLRIALVTFARLTKGAL